MPPLPVLLQAKPNINGGQRGAAEEPPVPPQPEPQHQDRQPGIEAVMRPPPQSLAEHYTGSGLLRGKVALITGGDSGIGRSTAVCFAKEGADVAIAYLNEHEDAEKTRQAVVAAGARCLLLAGDIGDSGFAESTVEQTIASFGGLDVLVNNAAEQHVRERIEEVSRAQLEQTFRTNFFALFELCRIAVPRLREGGCIINTTSVTAYRGSEHLLDYSASKGAIVSFTRSLAKQLAERGIRVNAVAPGPVWTPLIPSAFNAEHVAEFGKNVPLGRPAQPDEISPCFVFLASAHARYMTGQVLHPNGGEAVNA
jgi:NAD(P)-dependent dehydrogenase (short-subunit alcohol dehydrogenase family)